ncbi:hypothetical protein QUN95_000546 [Vibrio parahaemolyticus]|nr:hypothetical protein [Vibrio parahaemolyticus]EIY6179337.1 hypothetical protein [Vibrio parahaemolyticus]EKM6952040.1 hypothetical protein [Vibrio parahaemolyticus]ELA9350897.1 hypothetical protein [Vibrio parahaemolyticus]ELA9589968.1 hypothetical protein [Vibrio parahaemolyticus]
MEKKGLPHLLISMLSGRKSPEQTLKYIHTTSAQKASVIADIMFRTMREEDVHSNVRRRIQSQEQYDNAIKSLSPTFVSESGFCVQNLTLSPCSYMNDFESQCALCSSSCHVAHDEDAISHLMEDLHIQTNRLETVQSAINFISSEGMQKWYTTHYRNTCMLKELIRIMSNNNIKAGSIIRVISHSNVIRITDLDMKVVRQIPLELPDANEALRAAIEAKKKPHSSDKKRNFLSFLYLN